MLGLDRLHPREVTLGDSFRHAGYATGLIGKWHNGALDDFVGFRGGWMDYWDWWIERFSATAHVPGATAAT
jgi:arylsulfatase A